MPRGPWRCGLLLALLVGLGGCAAPSADPLAIRRLDAESLARLEAARPGRPLSLEEVVGLSRRGEPTGQILESLRATGTHHPLSPSTVLRLREQGVAPEVLDALAEAHERWARDEAAADKVRREQAAIAAETRAREEAYRRAWQDARWNSSWYWSGGMYGPGYHAPNRPFGPYSPFGPWGRSGWGIQYGR